MTFAPLQTIAMRDVEPRQAGAASGIINTTRQLGAVIGSAAVGALLQSQLSTRLTNGAHAQVAGPLADVPPEAKVGFVNGFKNAASAGLEVTGQAPKPAGLDQLPKELQGRFLAAGKAVFDDAFTHGMKVTLILPIAVMGLAALSVLLVRRRPSETPAEPASAADQQTVPASVDS
jgi:hypothetical protein